MGVCEPCGEGGAHLPECDHSARESDLILSRSLCADIHADRKRVMVERDAARAEVECLRAWQREAGPIMRRLLHYTCDTEIRAEIGRLLAEAGGGE